MKKVILAGGTGNLGELLSNAFISAGWQVVVLTRKLPIQGIAQVEYELWDGEHIGDWIAALESADVLVNLSGKSIQCRFTEVNKKLLYDSRIKSTQVLGKAIQQLTHKPKLWINFSGISLFTELSAIQDERSTTIGKGFLAGLSHDWENAFWDFEFEDVKQVVLRISPVLLEKSGFFAELAPLVKLGLGGHVGHGRQWMNWIHHTDLVRLVFWIINHENPSKIYHACSAEPISNRNFMRTFRKVANMSIGLPLPQLLARIGAFVKGVDSSLLLDSTPVTTLSTIEEGFVFNYPNVELALKELLKPL